jgi:hypothetical protein
LFGSEIDQMLSLARHGKLEEIVRRLAPDFSTAFLN